MPYRAMHFGSVLFGANANDFIPRRFKENRGLMNNKSYRPFGGASHYCPGRWIARRGVYVFIAIMLKRFDMELVEEKRFPKMDDTLPSGGVQGPLKGEDLVVRVRARG